MSTLAWLSDWMNYCRGGLLLTWIIAGSMVDEELAPEQELSFDAIMCLNGAIWEIHGPLQVWQGISKLRKRISIENVDRGCE